MKQQETFLQPEVDAARKLPDNNPLSREILKKVLK
jgi:hypothetical protein